MTRRYRLSTPGVALVIEEDDREFNDREQPTPRRTYHVGVFLGAVNLPQMSLRSPFAMRSLAGFLLSQATEQERRWRQEDRAADEERRDRAVREALR